jgi:hypothetical protein
VLAPRELRRATLVKRDAKGDKCPTGSSARAHGLEDPHLVSGYAAPTEGLTLDSQLARNPTSGCIATTRRPRGPMATLELVSTGTSMLANT